MDKPYSDGTELPEILDKLSVTLVMMHCNRQVTWLLLQTKLNVKMTLYGEDSKGGP